MTTTNATLTAPIRPDAALLLDYIAALESIIKSLPGKVTINGSAYSNEDGIVALRRHFDVTGLASAPETRDEETA